jgi:maleate isomerase
MPRAGVDRIDPWSTGSLIALNGKAPTMTRHFGVLIPSTNTTVEIECRLLPATYQAHVGRLMTSTPGRTFAPSRDEDIDYQARLLGTAKVELVILA